MEQFTKDELKRFTTFFIGQHQNSDLKALATQPDALSVVVESSFHQWNSLRKHPAIIQLEKEKAKGNISRGTKREAKRAIEEYQNKRSKEQRDYLKRV